jgi:hypothetical protein
MNELLPLYATLFVGRTTDFARQRQDGSYWRVGRALTSLDLLNHLRGHWTLGTYVRNEHGQCTYAVFDADSEGGLFELEHVQAALAQQDISSYLEQSRRGGHLWVFFARPVPASQARTWLLPWCPAGVEFYPKQAEGAGYGSLMRLPLGIHRRSGKRYPFVVQRDGKLVPVARSPLATLTWLSTVQRAQVPPLPAPAHPRGQETSFSTSQPTIKSAFFSNIRDWCAVQDPYRLIGAYVDLNERGIGRCPFSWHHAHGDTRPSFKVYRPGKPGGYCWYCYTWQQGGSVFDFLRYWHQLDARELWQRLQRNEVPV